jgi:hypothetical protein
VNPTTTYGVVFDRTITSYKGTVFLDEDNENVDSAIVINDLTTSTATCYRGLITDFVPYVSGQKFTTKDAANLLAGVYRVDASSQYADFLGLPIWGDNVKGGFIKVEKMAGGYTLLTYIGNTFTAKGTAYANSLSMSFAAAKIPARIEYSSEDSYEAAMIEYRAGIPIVWCALQPFIKTYSDKSDFTNSIGARNILGLTGARIINRHYTNGEPTDALGFTFTDHNVETLPNITSSRDVGKSVMFKKEKPMWWNGEEWIDANGCSAEYLKTGLTSQRPQLSDKIKGYQYFDTTIGKPIWWNGTAWVDSTGTAI